MHIFTQIVNILLTCIFDARQNQQPRSLTPTCIPRAQNIEITMKAFREKQPKTKEQIEEFLKEFFCDPGTELETCQPRDFFEIPRKFLIIQDPLYKEWALDLHSKWHNLCRKVKEDVKIHPQLYTLISVPHPFIAPGGRFRELYYWDSYWIIKGLIASEMFLTARDMIFNLIELVKTFGFVPNGTRIYYLNRSQPPVLPFCVKAYFQATNDHALVQEALPYLELEQQFWVKNRSMIYETAPSDGRTVMVQHCLFQYNVHAKGPRPESYREDLETAHHLHFHHQKERLWSDIASACESGWDFSSRWLKKGDRNDTSRHRMQTMRTSHVLPLDLNAWLCGGRKIIADLHAVMGNQDASARWNSLFEGMRKSIESVFWDEEVGCWFDMDLETGHKIKQFYASNLIPLYTGCTHDCKNIGRKLIKYLRGCGASQYIGGLPTSLEESGQQWDFPNGWPPCNHYVITGLADWAKMKSCHVTATYAARLADKWLQTNYFVYHKRGKHMFEQYDVVTEQLGHGAEYPVQEGFGWSNGVVLDLLVRFGDRLRAPPLTTSLTELAKLQAELELNEE